MIKWKEGKWWIIAMFLFTLLLSGCSGTGVTAQSNGSATPTSRAVPSPTLPKPNGSIVDTQLATTGCGKAAPASVGKTTNFTIASGGLKRTYLLHIPAGYTPQQMIPLVLNIHGLGETDQQQEGYSQYSTLADQEHFLVVYPQGVIGPQGSVGWSTYGRYDPTVNDVLFFSDLLTTLQQQLCVDPQRIYATGISNGGGMTNLLACTMAGRIAAFAAIAAAIYPIPGGCHPTRPVAYLEFHGTNDPLVHYTGVPQLSLVPVLQNMQDWATRDGCSSSPTTFFQQAEVTGFKWSKCQSGVVVEHYRIDGGGHTWPGAALPVPQLGVTTHTISATMLGWKFFQQYRLP